MSRRTFLIFLRILAVVIIHTLLLPRLFDYLQQPLERETVVGYSIGTALAVVDAIIEEGEITLGAVSQPYQILLVTVKDGVHAGAQFQIEYGTRQIRNDPIRIQTGDRLLVAISSLPDGTTSAHLTDFYRRNYLFLLFAIFICGRILISGWKGVRSLAGIMHSLAVIVLIILPGIQGGRDPLSVSILGALLFVGLSLYYTSFTVGQLKLMQLSWARSWHW